MVNSRGLAVETNSFEKQLIGRSSLHDNREMVPRYADRVARHSSRHPLMVDIIVDVPLMAASNPALMAPNVGFPAGELVNVELQTLRNTGIFHPEVNVVGEIVKAGIQRVFCVCKALRGKAADEVVVPQHVSPLIGSAAISTLGRNPIHRRGTHVLCP